jgi:hypothetical protein
MGCVPGCGSQVWDAYLRKKREKRAQRRAEGKLRKLSDRCGGWLQCRGAWQAAACSGLACVVMEGLSGGVLMAARGRASVCPCSEDSEDYISDGEDRQEAARDKAGKSAARQVKAAKQVRRDGLLSPPLIWVGRHLGWSSL